jgi:hypothetical protein
MTGYFLEETRRFSDYTSWPDLTETAVQGAILTESYGNFGLSTHAPTPVYRYGSGGSRSAGAGWRCE